MNNKKLDGQIIEFIKVLLWAYSPKTIEINEDALLMILTGIHHTDASSYDVHAMIKEINSVLPRKHRIVFRRGHRETYAKITPACRRELSKLLSPNGPWPVMSYVCA